MRISDWSSDVCSSDLSDAAAKAKRIYDLELKIARAHASREQSEDFTQSADVWAKADFAKKAPGIDWEAYFAAAGLDKAGKFGAYHANAITGLSALVASEQIGRASCRERVWQYV